MPQSKKLNWFQRTTRRMFLGEVEETNIPQSIRIINPSPIGSSGTDIFSGYIDEDYLSTLKGTQRADEFDKIRRSDHDVMMLLAAVKNLIKSAVWDVEPANQDDAESVADAELIKHIFFNDMATPWEQYVTEALTAADFGFAIFERVHKLVENHPKFGSYVGLKKLAWRSPRTIERWNINKETGELESVTQIAQGDLAKYVDIPAKFLTIITLQREGDNFEGISMLRGIYGCYKRKAVYMKLNAIGVEKFAIPTPTLQIPEVDISSDQYTNAIDALENFVSHESQYLTYPQGWDLKLVNNTYDPEKVEKSVDAEGARMARAFLANFLNLGQGGSSGSYALSNDLSDFFMSGLEFLAKLIVAHLNRVVIPELIEMSRGKREAYPKIIHSGIADKAGKELAETLLNLANGLYITPDDKTEEFLRKKYNLPKASDQGQRKPAQPSPFQALPAPIVPSQAPPVVDQPETQDVQKTVLNGAQVSSLVEVVSQVSLEQIPRESGVQIIMRAFNMEKSEAESLIGPAGKSFEPQNVGVNTQLSESLYKKIKAAEARRFKK